MLIADLHIHSKYSRATSKDGVPEQLELWARKKGIRLLGTGDFTHPAWRQELKDKLVPAEDGLYALRPDLVQEPGSYGDEQTRFVLSGEISSIYKKNGKTRKVHNVILLPSLEAADELSRKLEAIGNIHSDGRPILGLDSRDLLEITLEACPEAIFIPAHIWTPHFSLFGAFSGFDTIEECFEDLAPHIHALETGLSSDPPMNWRVSALDRFTLVSNSDAHSPAKLGREANLLDITPSYGALYKAIQTGEGFAGTIEFFPEEGKYHYDGHRNCELCLTPAETEQYGGRCPICGKKLTIGVQHRVEQLTDRAEGAVKENARPFESLVPLPEVIAASTGSSAAGKKTLLQYEELLHRLGSEFDILRHVPIEDLKREAGLCIAEGIRRLRAGEVRRTPGYDGEYGKIELLSKSEIDELMGQTSLLAGMTPAKKKKRLPTAVKQSDTEQSEELQSFSNQLNAEQQQAVTASEPVVAVIAGPGTGKTKTLISRIADLIEKRGVKPSEITAVTFTNKAAAEMRERLEKQFGGKQAIRGITIETFHAICLERLRRADTGLSLADEYQCMDIASETIEAFSLKLSPTNFLREISKIKNGTPADDTALSGDIYADYSKRLKEKGLLDFDDLLLEELSQDKHPGRSFSHLLVDEFQDINPIQYQLIQKWSQGGKSLFVIGDPDQSIYGFRGADAHCFDRLREAHPQLREIRLIKNYRSAPSVLDCSLAVISENPGGRRMLEACAPYHEAVRLVTAESSLSEGIFVAKEINRMVGGIDMLDAQSMHAAAERKLRGFNDIAILYRTHRQAELLEKCLQKESIPYVVAGRDDFLADATVRGVTAFLHFLLWPEDTVALNDALKLLWSCPADLSQSVAAFWKQNKEDRLAAINKEYEGIGRLLQWLEMTEQYGPLVVKAKPYKLLEELGEELGCASDEAYQKLLHTAVFHKDCVSLLNNLQLGQEIDITRGSQKSYAAGAVTLMTLHSSKGLEFPVVFLCGINKGTIPYESERRPADSEEERRLFFVGMTRAKEELILISSPEPSVFLKALPTELLRKEAAAKPKSQPDGIQMRLF